MKILLLALLSISILSRSQFVLAETVSTIEQVSDGFPIGNNTPEGVATDFVRSQITGNVALLKSSVLASCCFGIEQKAKAYEKLFREMVEGTPQKSHPRDAKKILKVFAARRTNAGSTESYLYAVDSTLDRAWKDYMFVDVLAQLNDGSVFVNRTIVVQLQDGRWKVHLYPGLSPLLRLANQEGESTVEVGENSGSVPTPSPKQKADL